MEAIKETVEVDCRNCGSTVEAKPSLDWATCAICQTVVDIPNTECNDA